MEEVINKDKADETKESQGEDNKLVAYKLKKPLGDNQEGDVVHLSEDLGKMLCESGHADLAKAEDMAQEAEDGEDEKEEGDSPMVANSVAKVLARKIEKDVAAGVAKTITKAKQPNTLPAEVAAPIYKSNGAYIKGIIKTILHPEDRTERNRVNAYQAQAVRSWEKLGVVDKSILGINETTNSSGGYVVNAEYSPDVYAIPHGQVNLQEMCHPIEAQSNLFHQRYINESSLANGSIFGGLNMVAAAEGASLTSSLPVWGNVDFTLQKLAIFVYYTVEVMEDASYPLEADLDEYVKKAFIYGINTQIIQGTTLEGVLNTPGLVTVTKSSNDTAFHTTPSTALTYADLANIWSSVYPDCQTSDKGVWLFHPALGQCLTQMTYSFSTGGVPAWGITYDAQDGLAGIGALTPYRIFSKPAFPCWAMSAPGAAGDIMYVDFNTFKLYRKPFRVEVSRDFQFGTDQVAVKFVSRLDCKTIFRNTVVGPTGTSSFSACVTRSASGT